MNTSNKPIQVVYIIGYGRSGSTILDTILGNHPNIESVGELAHLPHSGWINNEYCACGKRGNDCLFWTEVRQMWLNRMGINEITEYITLQTKFRQWSWLLKEQKQTSAQFLRYTEYTQSLFEVISAVSGKSVVVDSSKSPTRAFALSMIPKIDLHFIHLVRDGRSVAWSLQKAWKKNEITGIQHDIKPRPIWRTALSWNVINLTSAWVLKQVTPDKSIRIRYEDFVTQPDKTVKQIGCLTGLDFTQIIQAIRDGIPLPVGHTIAGNRLRMKGKVVLNPNFDWVDQMPRNKQWLFYILSGWLMTRYGYKWSQK